jgi:hypothetical protein
VKQREVVINGTYWAKVSDKVVKVRITATHPGGGWWGYSLATGRTVRIRSAQRLRGSCEPS